MELEQKTSGNLKEAIALKLVRPPVEKRGKREMPQKLPGKPLSEYLKEDPSEKPYSHVIPSASLRTASERAKRPKNLS